MKLLAILALAVLAASHLPAQTEAVIKTKATDALTESIVIPSGKSVTIASGATITAASGSTVTGFGGTPAWGDITSTPANVTAFGELANAAGVLTNNGSGTFSYTGTSAGGNAGSDFGKIALYNFSGHLVATALSAQPASAGYPRTAVLNTGLSYTHQAFLTTTLGFVTPSTSRVLQFPDETGTLISTGGTGTVTNAMLAGSIAISKLAITGTPNGTKFLRDDGTWAAASTDLASPGPIGGTTPSTGAFTTMTATNSALGATTAQAVSLINSTAAANGAQQVSPALLWQGKGWGTTAGTSQTIAMRTSLTPVQDTTPSTKLVTQYNINNAGWNDLLTLDSSGSMLFNGTTIGTSPGHNMYSLAAGSFYILGHSGAWKVALESDTLYSWTDKAVGLGNSTHGWKELWVGGILIATGTGTPEGAVTAPVGSLYTNQSNGDLYRKTSGTGNTGWVTP